MIKLRLLQHVIELTLKQFFMLICAVSSCVAVFWKFHRVPPGPDAVHDEILAGPEADRQAQAPE